MKTHPTSCNSCPHLTIGLCGNKAQNYCSHPNRVWQDMCKFNGFPLSHDTSKTIWSECAFKRGEGAPTWRRLNLPNNTTVFIHISDTTNYNLYAPLANSINLSYSRPMLDEGIYLDGTQFTVL